MRFSRRTEAPACAQYPPKVLPRQVLGSPSRCPALRFVEALGSLLVLTLAVCRVEASAGAKPAWLPVLVQFPLLCLMFGGFPEVQRAPQASERGSQRPSLSLFQRLRHPGLLTAAGRKQHCVATCCLRPLRCVSRIRMDKCAKLPRTALPQGRLCRQPGTWA